MRWISPAWVLALFGALPAVRAATIQFTDLPENQSYGTYNGFSIATVDGLSDQLLICDDYDHTTYMPSPPLTYTVSTLAGLDAMEDARFVSPKGLSNADVTRYREAALLLDGLTSSGPNAPGSTIADYQYALWHLFTPSAPIYRPEQQQLLDTALARVESNDAALESIYSRLRIYTPAEGFTSNQEFLQESPVPEPGTMVLIGGALVIAAAVLRRSAAARRKIVKGVGDTPASERL
ncbi:MAG TPA: PEP-CTERM sorting domain-containing protein [Bryobacteraceae bacterium]|nr:PEP-CTERM sorting domain-containing protein [Bryobacteraceae bacterium]